MDRSGGEEREEPGAQLADQAYLQFRNTSGYRIAIEDDADTGQREWTGWARAFAVTPSPRHAVGAKARGFLGFAQASMITFGRSLTKPTSRRRSLTPAVAATADVI